jgi:hypothetical protein
MNHVYRFLTILLLVAIFFSVRVYASSPVVKGQQETAPDSVQKPAQTYSPVYYGGTLGFNFFGDVFSISVQPLVGYKFTPQLSGGITLAYQYVNDKRLDPSRSYHNYGGSVFSRYRIIPQIYAHAEFAYISYDLLTGREAVPFLLLGGGYSQRIAPSAWAYVQVLFDVLQDSNSPYKNWDPWISIGVAAGF